MPRITQRFVGRWGARSRGCSDRTGHADGRLLKRAGKISFSPHPRCGKHARDGVSDTRVTAGGVHDRGAVPTERRRVCLVRRSSDRTGHAVGPTGSRGRPFIGKIHFLPHPRCGKHARDCVSNTQVGCTIAGVFRPNGVECVSCGANTPGRLISDRWKVLSLYIYIFTYI